MDTRLLQTDKRIIIFDTTLRDGDQSPLCVFTFSQKLKIAELLDKAGVDIIEAGFPCSSQIDYDSCKAVVNAGLNAVISLMCRALPGDIQRTAAVFENTRNPEKAMLHLTLPVSQNYITKKLQKTPSQILEIAAECTAYAKKFCSNVEIGAEDATRADPDFLIEYCKIAVESGASVVNIADTVGASDPLKISQLIRLIINSVPYFSDGRARLSIHCHNDLSLACANTLAALDSGCLQAEVTAAGIGERSGNTALEELYAVLLNRNKQRSALKDRPSDNTFYSNNVLSYSAGILDAEPQRLKDAGKYVFSVLGSSLSPLKPVTGSRIHDHASGIHQKGILTDSYMYSSSGALPADGDAENIVISRHSGKAGLMYAVKEYANVLLKKEQAEQILP